MEQRLNVREPVELTVRLIQHGRIVATAQTIDMSSEGLSIERPDVVLKSGQLLAVDFIKPGYPRGISYCIPSMVVHSGPEAVGLILAYDPHLRMTLSGNCANSSALDDQGVSHVESAVT